MTSLALASLPGRRLPYSGRTDTFMPSTRAQMGDIFSQIKNAKAGVAPFDAVGSVMQPEDMSLHAARLNRYSISWRMYDGEHFRQMFRDGDRKTVVNYCKRVVDKGVDWAIGSGMTISCPSGNEQIAEMLDTVWRSNKKNSLLYANGQYGAVTGDSFMLVSVKSTDESGKTLPKDKWAVYIDVLNPAFCHPIWDSKNPKEMSAMYVQYPIHIDGQVRLYTLYITPTEWTTWIDYDKKSTQPNPFGKVNVIHFPNLPVAGSPFGVSDMDVIADLNVDYNTVASSVKRTLKYHAEPTTLIFGIRASALERGADKVWSNLPVEARVENLKLDSDLNASMSYLEFLKDTMCELSETPRISLDPSSKPISNASGVALQLMFQSLLEKTHRRQAIHKERYEDVNELILIAHSDILGDDLGILADEPESIYMTTVTFPSPLPKDEQSELDLAIKRKEAKLWSHAEAIRRVGYVGDAERNILELAADDRLELAMTAEKAKANTGLQPNLSVVFLGSMMLSEDFEALAAKCCEQEEPPEPVVESQGDNEDDNDGFEESQKKTVRLKGKKNDE